jgi:transcription initiation factor IIE alpha subunit
MNGRITNGDSSEARLAAVVMAMLKKRTHENWWTLDYADFETTLKPHIEREKIHAILEELREQRTLRSNRGIDREQALFKRLFELETEITNQGL